MSRLEHIPRANKELMDFAGTRLVKPSGNGKAYGSFIKAIRTKEDLKDHCIYSPTKDRAIRSSFYWHPMDAAWKEHRRKIHEKELGYLDKQTLSIKDLLLSFGGEDVCFLGCEEDAENILRYGQFWFGKSLRMMKGRPNRCHANAANLWNNNKDLTRICTGYALSPDGLWRQHSWLVHLKERSNQIVETTVPRVGYFGFCMTQEQCAKFARQNY